MISLSKLPQLLLSIWHRLFRNTPIEVQIFSSMSDLTFQWQMQISKGGRLRKKAKSKMQENAAKYILTEMSSEMFENSCLAFFEIHELPSFKLPTCVNAFSICSFPLLFSLLWGKEEGKGSDSVIIVEAFSSWQLDRDKNADAERKKAAPSRFSMN